MSKNKVNNLKKKMKVHYKLFHYNEGISAIYLCYIEALGKPDLRGEEDYQFKTHLQVLFLATSDNTLNS